MNFNCELVESKIAFYLWKARVASMLSEINSLIDHEYGHSDDTTIIGTKNKKTMSEWFLACGDGLHCLSNTSSLTEDPHLLNKLRLTKDADKPDIFIARGEEAKDLVHNAFHSSFLFWDCQDKENAQLLVYGNPLFPETQKGWINEDHPVVCCYITLNQQVVSVALLSKMDFDPFEIFQNPWTLDFLFTSAPCRNQGLGSYLLQQVKQNFEVTLTPLQGTEPFYHNCQMRPYRFGSDLFFRSF